LLNKLFTLLVVAFGLQFIQHQQVSVMYIHQLIHLQQWSAHRYRHWKPWK